MNTAIHRYRCYATLLGIILACSGCASITPDLSAHEQTQPAASRDMKHTITISDLEAIREAVIRFYDSSDYSNRKELIAELRRSKPWIDIDGVPRIGRWEAEVRRVYNPLYPLDAEPGGGRVVRLLQNPWVDRHGVPIYENRETEDGQDRLTLIRHPVFSEYMIYDLLYLKRSDQGWRVEKESYRTLRMLER